MRLLLVGEIVVIPRYLVTLKKLYSRPAFAVVAVLFYVLKRLLNLTQDSVNLVGVNVFYGNVFSLVVKLCYLFNKLVDTHIFARRNRYNRYSELFFKKRNVDFVAVFFEQIAHIQRNYNRSCKLCKLGCKVEISL